MQENNTQTPETNNRMKQKKSADVKAESKGTQKTSGLAVKLVAFFIALLMLALLILNLLATTKLYDIKETLQAENDSLKSEVSALKEEKLAAETDTSFDYLAIGNSITQHPVYGDYWWGEWGMAASSEEKDYFHQVAAAVSEKYEESTTQALNYTIWEKPFYEREDALKYLKGYVTEDLDLVTIQLGENLYLEDDEDVEKLDDEYEDLINYIKEHAPNAQILVLGQFWENGVIDAAKQKACQETASTFVSLAQIQDLSYRVGMDAEVLGADGDTHTIDNQPVSEHPGDEAMTYIANAIIAAAGL